jgi:ribosomal protein S18 acetylase RimI-like enzyme
MPSIRTYRHPEDFAAVRALWESMERGIHLGKSDTPEEVHRKVLHDPDLFLVAEQDREVIAALMGGFDGRRGLLYHLAVARSHRKRGLGMALMREMERRLRSKGCLKCYLLVTSDNPEALRYYQQQGWSEMTEVRLMGKELS